MRTFILLSAIPGSGKSTWAKEYQKTHPNTFIVSSDEIRLELFGKPNDFRDEARVWATYLDTINKYAKEDNVTVIGDATNLENRFRKMYFEKTPLFDHHILVLFKTPYEICKKQNEMRSIDRIVPLDAMERLKNEYEEPSKEVLDLYDEYIEISSYHVKTI